MKKLPQFSIAVTVFSILSFLPALLLADCSCNVDTASRIIRDRFIEDYAKSIIVNYTDNQTAYILSNIVQNGGVEKSFNLTAFLAKYTDNIADYVLKGGLINITWGNVTDRTLNVKVFSILGTSSTVGLPDYLGTFSETLNGYLRKIAGDYSYPLGAYRAWYSRSYGYSCLSTDSRTGSFCTRWPWNVHRFQIALLAKEKLQLARVSEYSDWNRPYSSLLVTDIELAVDSYLSTVYNQSYIQSTLDRCDPPGYRYFNMTLYFQIPYDSSSLQSLNTSLHELKALQLRYLNKTMELEQQPSILQCYKGSGNEPCYSTQNGGISNNEYGAGYITSTTAKTTTTLSRSTSPYTIERTTLTQSFTPAASTTTTLSLETTETSRHQTETSSAATTTSTENDSSTASSSSTSTQVQSTNTATSPETSSTILSTDSTLSTITEPISSSSTQWTNTATTFHNAGKTDGTVLTDAHTSGTLTSTSSSSSQSTLTDLTSYTSSSVVISTVTKSTNTEISSTLMATTGAISSVSAGSTASSASPSSSKQSSVTQISAQTMTTIAGTKEPAGQSETTQASNPYLALANGTGFPKFEDEPTFYARVPAIPKVYNDPVLLKRFGEFDIFVTMSSFFYTITIPVALGNYIFFQLHKFSSIYVLVLLVIIGLCLCLLQKDWLAHGKITQNEVKSDLKY